MPDLQLTFDVGSADPAPTEEALTLLGAETGGSPVLWVGLHRLHHARSDGEGDPHSPRDGGFGWAHAGWLIGTRRPLLVLLVALSGFGQQGAIVVLDARRVLGRNPPVWRDLCGDLMKEPLMRALDHHPAGRDDAAVGRCDRLDELRAVLPRARYPQRNT